MKSKYQFLCDELRFLLKKENEIGFQILERLKQFEDSKLFLDNGYGSLFAFCVEELKMSESQAYTRINAMREMKKSEVLKEKLKSGEIKASQVAEVTRVKNELKKQGRPVSIEQSDNLILGISGKTQEQTKKIIQQTLQPEKPQTKKIILELDEESVKLFEAYKADQSHKLQTCSNETAFKLLLKKTVKPKPAPVCSDSRDSLPRMPEKITLDKKVKPHSRYVPKMIVEQPKVRSKSQCEFVDPFSGLRCSSKHYLEIDHIQSFSQGGRSDDIKNLQILCKNHNQRKFEIFG